MYKITGIVFFIAGAAYMARALNLIRMPGELPLTNTYPLVIGALLCVSALGVCICGADKNVQTGNKLNFNYGVVFISLMCYILFSLVFEAAGAINASFALSFLLGAIWKLNIAINFFVSCACAAGIWGFERIFNLMLP